jgi:hypothetical protein
MHTTARTREDRSLPMKKAQPKIGQIKRAVKDKLEKAKAMV